MAKTKQDPTKNKTASKNTGGIALIKGKGSNAGRVNAVSNTSNEVVVKTQPKKAAPKTKQLKSDIEKYQQNAMTEVARALKDQSLSFNQLRLALKKIDDVPDSDDDLQQSVSASDDSDTESSTEEIKDIPAGERFTFEQAQYDPDIIKMKQQLMISRLKDEQKRLEAKTADIKDKLGNKSSQFKANALALRHIERVKTVESHKAPYFDVQMQADIKRFRAEDYTEQGSNMSNQLDADKELFKVTSLKQLKQVEDDTEYAEPKLTENSDYTQSKLTQLTTEQIIQGKHDIRYWIRGGIQFDTKPEDYQRTKLKFSGFGEEVKETPPKQITEQLQKMIEVINKNHKKHDTHNIEFPMTCTSTDGRSLIPLRHLEDGKAVYKNMGDIGDGLYAVPSTFWDIPDLKCQAYILSLRGKRLLTQKCKDQLDELFQTSQFNPHLYRLLMLQNFWHNTIYTCFHFFPSSQTTAAQNFPRHKSFMAVMEKAHADKYIPTAETITEILLLDDSYFQKSVESFTGKDEGWLQHCSCSHNLKQYCHDMCQESTKLIGRVSPTQLATLAQMHCLNLHQAQDFAFSTPISLFWILVLFSKITLNVEDISQILAACNGIDCVEFRFLDGVPICAIGSYLKPRTLINTFVMPKTNVNQSRQKNPSMPEENQSEFYYKKVDSFSGLVVGKPVYSFDYDAIKNNSKESKDCSLKLFKADLIRLIYSVKKPCPDFDKVVFEIVFGLEEESQSVQIKDSPSKFLITDAKQINKPISTTRFVMQGNAKLFTVNMLDDIKIRMSGAGTLTSTQDQDDIYSSGDDHLYATANGMIGLDQEMSYESFYSWDDIKKFHSPFDPQQLNKNQSKKLDVYSRMTRLIGLQIYVLMQKSATPLEAARVHQLLSATRNEEARHCAVDLMNHASLVDLALHMQEKCQKVKEYPKQHQQLQRHRHQTIPTMTFKTLYEDGLLADNTKDYHKDLEDLVNQVVKLEDAYKPNIMQKQKPYHVKLSSLINTVLQDGGNSKLVVGLVKDQFGSTMNTWNIRDILDINFGGAQVFTTEWICARIKDYVLNQKKQYKMRNSDAVLLYLKEVIAATKSNSLPFKVVAFQHRAAFPDFQLEPNYKLSNVRLPLTYPYILKCYRELPGLADMPDHEACTFIFTDNANWGKFIVRAAFALFLKMPWFCTTHEQQNWFTGQDARQVKAFSYYHIYTFIVRSRNYFLKQLTELLPLRAQITSQVGDLSDTFLRGFILDPMVNNQFDTFDPTQPFNNFDHTPLNYKGIGVMVQTKEMKCLPETLTKSGVTSFGLARNPTYKESLMQKLWEDIQHVTHTLFPDYYDKVQLKGDYYSMQWSKQVDDPFAQSIVVSMPKAIQFTPQGSPAYNAVFNNEFQFPEKPADDKPIVPLYKGQTMTASPVIKKIKVKPTTALDQPVVEVKQQSLKKRTTKQVQKQDTMIQTKLNQTANQPALAQFKGYSPQAAAPNSFVTNLFSKYIGPGVTGPSPSDLKKVKQHPVHVENMKSLKNQLATNSIQFLQATNNLLSNQNQLQQEQVLDQNPVLKKESPQQQGGGSVVKPADYKQQFLETFQESLLKLPQEEREKFTAETLETMDQAYKAEILKLQSDSKDKMILPVQQVPQKLSTREQKEILRDEINDRIRAWQKSVGGGQQSDPTANDLIRAQYGLRQNPTQTKKYPTLDDAMQKGRSQTLKVIKKKGNVAPTTLKQEPETQEDK